MLWVIICSMDLTFRFCHVMYTFQSKFTLYICLNVKELLSRYICDIPSLIPCNRIRTSNQLVRKQTMKHFTKLYKKNLCFEYLSVPYIWLYVVVISCKDFRVNQHSIFAKISRNYFLKKVGDLKFKWTQRDWNPKPLSW